MTKQEQMRILVQEAVRASDYTQANLARRLGLSEKHLSQMLTGQAKMPLEWAAGILDMIGMTLDIRVVRGLSEEQRRTYYLTHRGDPEEWGDPAPRQRHAAGECG